MPTRAGALVAIVILACAVRLAIGLTQVRTNGFIAHGSSIYAAWAFNVAKFGRLDIVENSMSGQLYVAMGASRYQRLVDPADIVASGQAVTAEPPGHFLTLQPFYSVIAGAIWAVTHDYRFISLIVGQALLDALVCLLAYAAAARVWGAAYGLIAAAAYAVFIPQAQLTAYTAPNLLAAPLLLGLCVLLQRIDVRAGDRRRFLHAGLVGVVMGAGLLTLSPFGGLFVPAGLVVVWCAGWRKAASWVAVAALACLVVVTPWCLRTWRISGQFRPIPQAFWYNVHWGLIEQRDSPFGSDASFGWPREEEKVASYFQKTRGISVVPSAEAERAFRAAVIDMISRSPGYALDITAARFASILLMSGPSELVERSLYTLGADMTFYTRQSLDCYRQAGKDPTDIPTGYCDAEYLLLNPWPRATRAVLEALVRANYPLRIRIDGIGPYANAGDATLAIVPLALIALAVGWRRARVATTAYALVVFAWAALYAINHVEPRYVAAVHAMLWMAASVAVAHGISAAWMVTVRLMRGASAPATSS